MAALEKVLCLFSQQPTAAAPEGIASGNPRNRRSGHDLFLGIAQHSAGHRPARRDASVIEHRRTSFRRTIARSRVFSRNDSKGAGAPSDAALAALIDVSRRFCRSGPIYRPKPTFMYFPHLPEIEFYERADFPWLDSIEAAATTSVLN